MSVGVGRAAAASAANNRLIIPTVSVSCAVLPRVFVGKFQLTVAETNLCLSVKLFLKTL